MQGSRSVKKTVIKLEKMLKSDFKKEISNEWLSDNKNKILSTCHSLTQGDYRGITQRVLELAKQLVEQGEGIIDSDTVLLTKRFKLSLNEYGFLESSIKINLLWLIHRCITEKAAFEKYAPNAVKSLLFTSVDYGELFKCCVESEAILSEDCVFSNSDERTRAQYREKITELCKKSKYTEAQISSLAVQNNLTESIFGEKSEQFARTLGIKAGHAPINTRLMLYALVAFVFTVIIDYLAFTVTSSLLFSIIALVPITVALITLENSFILKLFKPTYMKRMKKELADTPQNKCAVTLTVMVKDNAGKLLSTLEEYYACNKLDNGVYLLLCDLSVEKTETVEDDKKIISELCDGIEELNKRFDNRFALIIRKRVKQEGGYFGYERKRGAIESLIEYITCGKEDFGVKSNIEALAGTRYICTLDGDTVLIPDTVKKLLSVAMHPTNKKYGIIQPAIQSFIRKETAFAEIFSPSGGVDSYATPQGEVYNDFLCSGTFCGKGLINVEMYKKFISGRIKPNTVLSHDILEGELCTCRDARDIMLFDDFPQSPVSFYKRAERWIRGDVQLVPYLFTRLKPVSKWKILYNILLALYCPFLFLMLAFTLIFDVRYGLCFALGLATLPIALLYFNDVLFCRRVFKDNKRARLNIIKREAISLCFLPTVALLNACAVAKGLYRRLLSHKNVLEWSPYSSTEKPQSSFLLFRLSVRYAR